MSIQSSSLSYHHKKCFNYMCINFHFLLLFSSIMAIQDVNSSNRLEEGFAVIQEAVDKAIWVSEGIGNYTFCAEDYMRYYKTIYELCCPHPLGDFSQQFYDRYKKIFDEYITDKVLPSLMGKRDQDLLQELERRWSTHKSMTRWVSRFFYYLERYFIPRRKLPSLKEISFMCFYNLVYVELNGQVRDAVISMINREREGQQIDQELVKNILSFYIEIGMDSMKYYEQDFEEAMLKNTAEFYSQKASEWMQNKSFEDYMLMANQCWKHEKDSVSCYLRTRTQNKLLEVVEHELLNVHANELEQKRLLGESPLADKQG